MEIEILFPDIHITWQPDNPFERIMEKINDQSRDNNNHAKNYNVLACFLVHKTDIYLDKFRAN